MESRKFMNPSNQIADEQTLRQVLSRYFEAGSDYCITPLKIVGFSGALLWKIDRGLQSFCLRQWPPSYPSLERLQYIHGILRTVAAEVTEVASPILDRSGQTIVVESGTLWELSDWKPGVADYHQVPSAHKLAAAMRVLARFHLAARRCGAHRTAPPPGLVARREQLGRLVAGEFERLRLAVSPVTWPELYDSANQILNWFPQSAPRIYQLLNFASEFPVALQPCIRDIWYEHVLFTGELVTGVVDFGAMQEDHIAADISRLLGSFVRDDLQGWQTGLAAYEELRPLSSTDRELVAAYDQSAVLLSGLNWLQWLYVEGRQFANPKRVRQRIAEIVGRLAKQPGNEAFHRVLP